MKETPQIQHFQEDRSFHQRARRKLERYAQFARTGYLNTDERVHPHFVTNNFVNHLRVYQFVSQFAHDKTVLDVGCGVGYGTAYLERTGSRATGIDISNVAIREAYRLYPDMQFRQMNAEDLSFSPQSFDLVVSSENFEHLGNQRKHVDELARVVRKDGLCIVASPNPELTTGFNPFHVKENTYSELLDLFSRRFREVEIVEPSFLPESDASSAARDRRFALGQHGKMANPDLEIFGKIIDQRFLSNTHSFLCFVRRPIQ